MCNKVIQKGRGLISNCYHYAPQNGSAVEDWQNMLCSDKQIVMSSRVFSSILLERWTMAIVHAL